MVTRLAYRRRHCYATRSNKVRKLKTPGGKLTLHYATKPAAAPKCGKCGIKLAGIPCLRPTKYATKLMATRQKSVTRAYGGSVCHGCVRERIVRAFLVEEQKIVKKVLKSQKAKAEAEPK